MAALARKRRGIVRASLTKFEERIIKFEGKELEVGDRPLIQHLIVRLEAMETEFKEHHQAVIDEMDEEEEDKLREEQTILVKNEDKVSNFMDRLIRLTEDVKAKEGGKPTPVPGRS